MPLSRLRTIAYLVSSALAAIGGIILTARVGAGQVCAGAPLLMDAVAAAYVGYAIFGQKKASVVCTQLGALLIGILLNGLTMLNVHEDTTYASRRDRGLTNLDVSERAAPALIAERNWTEPFGGGTHTALPLPCRELLVVAGEGIADNVADSVKCTWMFDIRNPANPTSISVLPNPAEDDFVAKGAHFGPHNLHENQPSSFQSEDLVFATYQNAGLRAYDIRHPFGPEEIGAWVPPAPAQMVDTRPGRPQVIQSFDVFVDREGLAYVTDPTRGCTSCSMRARSADRRSPWLGVRSAVFLASSC